MIGITKPAIALGREIRTAEQQESMINQYKSLASKYRTDFCLYSFRNIDLQKREVDALVYSYKKDNIERKKVTIPYVNIFLNRRYITDPEMIHLFGSLRKQNYQFINMPLYRQANKLKNYEYLGSFAAIKNHVPATRRLRFELIDSFIEQYGKVIIKPIYGSKGRGITIIEKCKTGYRICQTHLPNCTKKNRLGRQSFVIPDAHFQKFYTDTFPNPEAFLLQEWITFEEFRSRPYDIRAVMQKNGKNKWQITSRVARVASENSQITNLSQGGEMLSLSSLPLISHYGTIRKFCLQIAKAFEKRDPWTAEMGIDLAIDKSGKLWYIETNYCPEKTRWETICKTPFQYAYYLYTNISSAVHQQKTLMK